MWFCRTGKVSNVRTRAPFLSSVFLFTLLSAKQHLLAVGDALGTLHILEIPWSLRHPTPNEVNTSLTLLRHSLLVLLNSGQTETNAGIIIHVRLWSHLADLSMKDDWHTLCLCIYICFLPVTDMSSKIIWQDGGKYLI